MRVPDLTLAVRNLFRRPAFAVTAMLLLALGAGANAAVFSVVRGVLLQPLAYQQPEQLVAIWPESFDRTKISPTGASAVEASQRSPALSPGWLMALVADGQEPLKVTGGAHVGQLLHDARASPRAIGRTIVPGDATPGSPAGRRAQRGPARAPLRSDPGASGARCRSTAWRTRSSA